MPRYNYECTSCGPFAAWATIAASDEPAECPSCDAPSERALAAPFVGSGAPAPAPVCGMGACGRCALPEAG